MKLLGSEEGWVVGGGQAGPPGLRFGPWEKGEEAEEQQGDAWEGVWGAQCCREPEMVDREGHRGRNKSAGCVVPGREPLGVLNMQPWSLRSGSGCHRHHEGTVLPQPPWMAGSPGRPATARRVAGGEMA